MKITNPGLQSGGARITYHVSRITIMSYDEFLAERIERILQERRVQYHAKKMFGGVCHMVDDKICTGVMRNELLVRIDPVLHEKKLEQPGVSPLDADGGMRGFLMIDPENTDMDEDLRYWVDLALEFNPRAKATRK